MIDARFVPIEKWQGKQTARRIKSDFRSTYAQTLDLLETELRHLRAKDITIQAYFRRQDIRNDGWPRSGAPRPAQPGVIVSFIRKLGHYGGPNFNTWIDETREFSFPCDRFTNWEDNLRAIALALEALRKVDRYGVTQEGEQYKGWARLPAPESPDHMSREEAAAFLAGYSGIPKDLLNESTVETAYRRAAQKLHPDVPVSGSHELFVRLQKAKEILEMRP